MRDGWSVGPEVGATVASIVAGVRESGDAAIVEYTRRYDDEGYDLSKLRVPIPMGDRARSLVSREIADAFGVARDRIVRFHERQRQSDVVYGEEDGSRYAVHRHPLESVAAYVPGAAASMPLVLLMCVIPAKLAGVGRVIVLTPPHRGAPVDNAMLFACSLCDVDELYCVGGAQAIASAAYGTESVRKVEKIVGPGGVWVTEAKRQVFGQCGIDGLAGPAEVLIVADDGANSEYVAGELLAVAEHAGASRLAVVSDSRALLESVAQLLDTLDLKSLGRGINDAIENNCRLIAAASRDEIFEIVDRFAPAVLCLHVRDASAFLSRVRCAGTVFVGEMTPLACGAALAGTNGVVPTSGTARFSSGLSLNDFTRSISLVENSMERMMNDELAVSSLAELEGLPQNAATARMRYGG